MITVAGVVAGRFSTNYSNLTSSLDPPKVASSMSLGSGLVTTTSTALGVTTGSHAPSTNSRSSTIMSFWFTVILLASYMGISIVTFCLESVSTAICVVYD